METSNDFQFRNLNQNPSEQNGGIGWQVDATVRLNLTK